MKKALSLILSFILMLPSFALLHAAAESEAALPFSYDVYPEKATYEKGEEIFICISLENTSLDTVTDMRLWVDYPQTDYYLTPGVTERFIESLTDTKTEKMRIVEDNGVLEFASKFENTTLIRSFLLKLANAYKSLTLAYATMRYAVQHPFTTVNQRRADLKTVSVIYDGTEIDFSVKCRYTVKPSVVNEATLIGNESGMACADIKAVNNSYTGLTFAMNKDKTEFGLFTVNPDLGKACLFSVNNGTYHLLATKSVAVQAEKFYHMQVLFESNRVICYLLSNPNETNPYPSFDVYYNSSETGYGVFCREGGFKNFNVTSAELPTYEIAYTNPVYENAPDPFILKEGKTYYLYATTGSTYGFQVSTSTDLVNWKNAGYCAEKGNIYGSGKFWAPEVYHYRDKYYLLYSTDVHLALATSDSPTGPFLKTKDGYLLEDECIDGHLLFDDDGSIYLYMAYMGETGEEIWGCRMASDLSDIVPGTLTQLTYCKDDEGGINEGPYMLKYQGKYYLTYSVNGYENPNYSVRLAVSDSPLGVYEGKGTILEKSGSIIGTGHHCFTTSPDGKELIIAYHCHYSKTQIHNRRLCIDRCRFEKAEDGYTISVYGPTSTPQPYPSAD